MTLDFTKVEHYKIAYLHEYDPEESANPPQTLDQALISAQQSTDRGGNSFGIYKLIKYTEPAAPRATVLDVDVPA